MTGQSAAAASSKESPPSSIEGNEMPGEHKDFNFGETTNNVANQLPPFHQEMAMEEDINIGQLIVNLNPGPGQTNEPRQQQQPGHGGGEYPYYYRPHESAYYGDGDAYYGHHRYRRNRRRSLWEFRWFKFNKAR